MVRTSIDSDTSMQRLFARLSSANAAVARAFPGETLRRQPVHTVYGGAQLFRHDSAGKLSAQAIRALEEHAPDGATLARALGPGFDASAADTLRGRVLAKLRREAVEDFRIDFEDGYGNRSDDEEDGHAEAAARAVARGMAEGTLPPAIGIRIKTFSDERLRLRAVRTADVFLTTLCAETNRKLPPGFVVCLPKIRHPEHVAVLADVLGLLEERLGLPRHALKLEIMIESPQAILEAEGTFQLPLLLDAADGRCIAAHFGTYDYTASCNITAAHQRMNHPACDLARLLMIVAYAGTGITLSDGATNVLPIGPHAAREGAPPLTDAQREENRAVVHRAWKLHFDDVQASLRLGLYQGWDLHPAQLPSRFAALFDFFQRRQALAAERLRNFVVKAGQATLVDEVFEDAATGQGLLNFFLRALNAGALTEAEVLERTSLTAAELRSRSFLKILEGRRR